MITNFCMPTTHISHGGEWATISYRGIERGGHQGGELMIYSSRGTWAHHWSNVGQPFERFLATVSYDYLMGKLAGDRRDFDFHASMASWKKHLLMARRTRQITDAQLREIWDSSCCQAECGIELFLTRIDESRPVALRDHGMFDDLSCYAVCRRNVQAEAFWRELWPHFVRQLTDRMEAANDQASQAA